MKQITKEDIAKELNDKPFLKDFFKSVIQLKPSKEALKEATEYLKNK